MLVSSPAICNSRWELGKVVGEKEKKVDASVERRVWHLIGNLSRENYSLKAQSGKKTWHTRHHQYQSFHTADLANLYLPLSNLERDKAFIQKYIHSSQDISDDSFLKKISQLINSCKNLNQREDCACLLSIARHNNQHTKLKWRYISMNPHPKSHSTLNKTYRITGYI